MNYIKYFSLALCCSMALTLVSCSPDNGYGFMPDFPDGGGMTGGGMTPGDGGAGGPVAGTGDLLTFGVSIDKTSAEPSDSAEEYFPDEEDMLENNTFGTEVNITFDGGTASFKDVSGVTITTNGAHVVADHGSTKGVHYVVIGSTTSGSLTILGDKKYELELAGVSITNPDSTAINLLSGKRAYIVLKEGTENTLTDSASSKDDDQKGAFYCKGKMLFNGSGKLEVYGKCKNGIHCADYIVFRKGNNVYVNSSANHGIKANDGIYINGGIINVEVSEAAAKGINCESNIIVNGGRTVCIATGGGAVEDGEAKGAAGVKCDSTLTVNGGEIWTKATGNGGKGVKADWEAYFNGGSIYAVTEGGKYTYGQDKASPKGVKIGTKNVHGVLEINGSSMAVRTKGVNGEGIESKGTLSIADGTVRVAAYDDGINSAGDMRISGGDITSVGVNSDGLDSNRNMYISGGSVVAFGAGGAETGIDTGEQYRLYITGGNIFGIGGRYDITLGSTSQGIICATGTVSANASVTVSSGSTKVVSFTMPPYSYSSGAMLISAPGLKSGTSYTLASGTSSTSVTAGNSISSR